MDKSTLVTLSIGQSPPEQLYLSFLLHLVYAALANHNYGLRNGVDLRKDARVISNTIGKRCGVRYV